MQYDVDKPTTTGLSTLYLMAALLCHPLHNQPVLSSLVLALMLVYSVMVIQFTACFVFFQWPSLIGALVAMSDVLLIMYTMTSVMPHFRFPGLFRVALWNVHACVLPLWLVPQVLYITVMTLLM
jgi:hypothetical protein